jgi:hypothetical protein
MAGWGNADHRTLLLPANEVTVLFDDRMTTFSMPARATLAELAERVATGGAASHRVVAVAVRLGRAATPSPFRVDDPADAAVAAVIGA